MLSCPLSSWWHHAGTTMQNSVFPTTSDQPPLQPPTHLTLESQQKGLGTGRASHRGLSTLKGESVLVRPGHKPEAQGNRKLS